MSAARSPPNATVIANSVTILAGSWTDRVGIEHEEHRARAIDIGERLAVLKDYPTPPNCTSPFAPVWIAEMVRRRQNG